MFIGHYGASFAAKQKPIPLWLLFVAVQFLDVVWSVLVILGIEKLRITPGITAANALDLYYMPYTHGLIGALALSVAFGAAAAWFFAEDRRKVFAILAACVFSHWLLDFVVHTEDLPLLGDSMKVGLGVWNYRAFSFALEIGTLLAGVALYVRNVPSQRRFGDTVLWVFVAAMVGVEIYAFAGPNPASPLDEAQTALAAYLLLAVLAGLTDWARGTAGLRKPQAVPSLLPVR